VTRTRLQRYKCGWTIRIFRILLVSLLPALAADLQAETLSITTPGFVIPLNNQTGTLNLFSDGSAPQTSGFNALGSQTFTLAGNSSSTGTLYLNLHFSGFTLDEFNLARLVFTVHDLDFFSDQITPEITLLEMATLDAVSGAPLAVPINLANYLPGGTTVTDEQAITLMPIVVTPAPPDEFFSDPFVLALTLRAQLTNTGSTAVTLLNTPEQLVSDVSLTFERGGDPLVSYAVPEPSSLVLLGSCMVLAGLLAPRYRQAGRKS
jgi:hypothetical protein